jgi:hypothetical protein
MVKKNEVIAKKEISNIPIKKEIPNIPKKEVQNNSNPKVEQVLIENFVSLQKVMTNLAVKFDSLSGQISKLLELFEISAKTLAEKDYAIKTEPDKKVGEKVDAILEQNKIIAKGIALLHEREMEAITGTNTPQPATEQTYPSPMPQQKIIPRPTQAIKPQSTQENFQGSQSIM